MPFRLPLRKEKPGAAEKPPAIQEVEPVPEVEKTPEPERKKIIEQEIKKEEIKVKPPARKIPFRKKPEPEPTTLVKSKTARQIESILSDNLQKTYQSLPENLKGQFKEKGEETARQIEKIISQAKIAVHKIVELIKNWLSMIPKVNKFFLEQETKIKTGKILELAKKRKK